jgi:Flp pilus assembly protein TadG
LGVVIVQREIARVRSAAARLTSSLHNLVVGRRGAVSPMMALSLIPIIGALAMAGELGNWYLLKRNLQNAADSAAIAAAETNTTTRCTTAGDYCYEARAVSSRYGFTNASSNVTVDPQYQTCPSPSTLTNCYKVTITKKVPLYLTPLVGFIGDTTISGAHAQTVSAYAIASGKGLKSGYCMVGLGASGDSITLSGGNGTDLTGCNMASNGNMKCNGTNSDDGVFYGDAVGTSNCGDTPRGGGAPIDLSSFNYTQNASLLNPSPMAPYLNTCTSNHYLTDSGFSSLPSNQLSGTIVSNRLVGAAGGTTLDWSAQSVVRVCGDLNITGQINITTASGGTVLIIENGQVNLPAATPSRTVYTSGDSLTAAGLTIVFSGSMSDTTHARYPSGNGTLNFSAPTTGTWKGIALYQDPNIPNSDPSNKCNGANTGNLNYCNAGNKPVLNITGLVYFPNAYVNISGSIDHEQPTGLACFGLIAKTINISGTIGIFHAPTSECARAGLDLPGVPGTEARQALLQ